MGSLVVVMLDILSDGVVEGRLVGKNIRSRHSSVMERMKRSASALSQRRWNGGLLEQSECDWQLRCYPLRYEIYLRHCIFGGLVESPLIEIEFLMLHCPGHFRKTESEE